MEVTSYSSNEHQLVYVWQKFLRIRKKHLSGLELQHS